MRYIPSIWKQIGWVALLFLVLVSSCKKDTFVNPYDDPALQPPDTADLGPDLEPRSFEGIHNNIFRPTCANSGCHDGTFEPDFRSVESAYNTLIYQPVIKNDTQGSFTFRVLPGNADASVLYERLMTDIDGQSGIMPLELEPGSDWLQMRDLYREDIKAWINAGAPDMMGNLPTPGNFLPQLEGVVGYADGSASKMNRDRTGEPMLVPPGTNTIEVWLAITDVETQSTALTNNKLYLSRKINDFSDATEVNLSVVTTALNEEGYYEPNLDFYHKVTIDVTTWNPGNVIFMRTQVQDGGPELTELPNDGSAKRFKDYAAFKIQ